MARSGARFSRVPHPRARGRAHVGALDRLASLRAKDLQPVFVERSRALRAGVERAHRAALDARHAAPAADAVEIIVVDEAGRVAPFERTNGHAAQRRADEWSGE